MNARTDSVACPLCGAAPNDPCLTPSGVVRHDYPHLARTRAFRASVTPNTGGNEMNAMPVSTVGLPDLPGWHVRLFADGTFDGVNGRMRTGRHTSPADVCIAIETGAYLRTDDPADTTSLVPGTYVRESDGAGHIYHSDVSWNDPSYALMRWVRRETTSSLSAWRRVSGAEYDAVWALTHLAQGESWTYDGPVDGVGCEDETLAQTVMRETGIYDAAPRWVVVENTPGYLPEDDDPATFTDIDNARTALRERVAEYVEHLHEGTDWRDDYEPAVSIADDSLSAYVTDPDRIHDLGRVFEILPTEDN